MEFIAATNNLGKIKELKRILEGLGHIVYTQKEKGIYIEPEENGTTFEENAIIKASEICKASNMPTIADDSGIEVDALNGAPGVYTARYCGRHGDDAGNNQKLLSDLEGIEKQNRTARFVSAICVYMPNDKYFVTRGECPGYIGFACKGTNGFGYDPIFNIPQYNDQSYAEISDVQKDKISHRGKALAQMQLELANFLQEKACDK